MSRVDLVIFDIAGTTLKDNDAVNRIFRQSLSSQNIAVSHSDVNKVMGLAKPLAIHKLIKKSGSHKSASEISKQVDEIIQSCLRYVGLL